MEVFQCILCTYSLEAKNHCVIVYHIFNEVKRCYKACFIYSVLTKTDIDNVYLSIRFDYYQHDNNSSCVMIPT